MAHMQLVNLRKRAGLSLAKVAADLGTTPSTVNRHERGLTPLSGFHRHTYAIYYGVDSKKIQQPKPPGNTEKGRRAA